MYRVLTCLTFEHDWWLVVLAGVVCLLASVTAINLLHRAQSTQGRARVLWTVTTAAAAGCGIWATHFIAMLAYDPGVALGYDIPLTTLSLAAAVVITGIGFSIAVYGGRTLGALAGGALVGGGIAAMHYTGMSAVRLPGVIVWHQHLVGVSVVMGMLFGAVAMQVAMRSTRAKATATGAALLTLAIVSHHFTAMGAVEILPDPTRAVGHFSMSGSVLAVAVASAAMALLGMSFASAFAGQRMQARDIQLISAINNMPQGLAMFDATERMIACNERYLGMYGLSSRNVRPGASLREVLAARKAAGTLDDDPESYRVALLDGLRSGKPTSWVVERADGRAIAVTMNAMREGSWLATHEDITDRRKAEARIAHMAMHDALTDLPNRLAFTTRLRELIEQCKTSHARFGVLSLDIDRFKEVNDVFGHPAGDALLCELAKRLKAAAGDAFVARLGGDEFNILTPINQEPASIAALGERLLAVMNEDTQILDHRVRVGISVGVAMFPQDGDEETALLGNADAALYRAKREGRGTVRFFEADMDRQLREKHALHQELRRAVDRNEFVLYYQPQATVEGEVIGFEALVRWQHPTHGVIAPGTFVPLAEETGLIIQIGEWVLREACATAARWSKPLKIAVNLSPVQFCHGDLSQLVHTVLLETGLRPSRLELEITESVLIDDSTRAVATLRRLKALGVRITMDDFGTGYSSLSYLQAFPFDKMKIDRSFIMNLHQNPQSETIVRAVIGLAKGLNLPVVAEGVETKEQLAFLSEAECTRVQGYLVGMPLPIEAYAGIVDGTESAEDEPLRTATAA